MQKIVIPRLACPFPSTINPLVDVVERETDDWVAALRLYSEEDVERYRADRFSYLTARFYPHADRERLRLANDFFALLFAIDDRLDRYVAGDSRVRHDRHAVSRYAAHVLAIVEGRTEALPAGDPSLIGLVDVWQRLTRLSRHAWLQTFTASMKTLFDGARWEVENTIEHRLPGVERYLEIRQYLGAAHIATDLIEPIEQIVLPSAVSRHDAIRAAVQSCRTSICLANDLFSFTKEQEHGDGHNIVAILGRERGLTTRASIQHAAALHDAEVAAFIAARDRIPSFGRDIDAEVSRFVEGLAAQMIGNIDWSERETQRYAFVFADNPATSQHS